MLRRLAVFTGARVGAVPGHADAAYAVGRALAEREITLVYGGGGSGLMGRLSRGAIDHGGRVVGVIPRFMVDREWGRVDEPGVVLEVVETMHQRKAIMAHRADAFLALPGGLGTLEELFEMWTWQTLALHAKPVGLLNVDGFWDPLVAMLERLTDTGYVSRETAAGLIVADTVDAALDALAEAAG